jgi:hypothetical protein
MSLEKKILSPVVETLNSMIADNQITIEHATALTTILSLAIDETRFELRTKIEDKIHLWDSMYGEQDKTLYALGLRHALDMINGEVATDRNGYDNKVYVEGQEFKIDEIVED